jgi:hypothetical protein
MLESGILGSKAHFQFCSISNWFIFISSKSIKKINSSPCSLWFSIRY